MSLPKTGLKYLRILYGNAPTDKAWILNEFLESEKVTVLPYPPFSPDLAPVSQTRISSLSIWKKTKLEKCHGSAIY